MRFIVAFAIVASFIFVLSAPISGSANGECVSQDYPGQTSYDPTQQCLVIAGPIYSSEMVENAGMPSIKEYFVLLACSLITLSAVGAVSLFRQQR